MRGKRTEAEVTAEAETTGAEPASPTHAPPSGPTPKQALINRCVTKKSSRSVSRNARAVPLRNRDQ